MRRTGVAGGPLSRQTQLSSDYAASRKVNRKQHLKFGWWSAPSLGWLCRPTWVKTICVHPYIPRQNT